eukprot:sb/3470870/
MGDGITSHGQLYVCPSALTSSRFSCTVPHWCFFSALSTTYTTASDIKSAYTIYILSIALLQSLTVVLGTPCVIRVGFCICRHVVVYTESSRKVANTIIECATENRRERPNHLSVQALYIVQSDPDLPGCAGERILPGKSGCPAIKMLFLKESGKSKVCSQYTDLPKVNLFVLMALHIRNRPNQEILVPDWLITNG